MKRQLDIYLLDELQLIKLAKRTKDILLLKKLSKSVYPNVRKCVAKNISTTKHIVNSLVFDKTLNVSYWALKNKNCEIKNSSISSTHPCVICEVDEEEYSKVCGNCQKIKVYNN